MKYHKLTSVLHPCISAGDSTEAGEEVKALVNRLTDIIEEESKDVTPQDDCPGEKSLGRSPGKVRFHLATSDNLQVTLHHFV